MKLRILSMLIFICSAVNTNCQQNYRGIVLMKDSLNHIDCNGIDFVDLELMGDQDSFKTITNQLGLFNFHNIPQIKVRLVGRKRNYYSLDTILHIQNWRKLDTFYMVRKKGKMKSNLIYNENVAQKDISNNNIAVLLPGGLAGTLVMNSDTLFENKYNVTYLSLGCTAASLSDEMGYNNKIFLYLDQTYGQIWRKEIRKDVLGLNNNAR